MITIEILEYCIQAIKDAGYYDDSTVITGIEFEEAHAGTLCFEARMGEIKGCIQFEGSVLDMFLDE